MTRHIEERLENTPLIALIQAADGESAVRTSRALLAGGISVIEVLLRNEAALDCLGAVAEQVPDAIVGAGTVLSAAQAEAALDAGAGFIVSPGLDERVIEVARSAGTPAFPGVCTATELQRAHNLGLEVVKFFPAQVAGGIPAIKALSSVFRAMRFIPTGGVAPANLADFLALPAVLACGGSWLTPASLVENGDFNGIRELAEQAVAITREALIKSELPRGTRTSRRIR